MVNFFSGRSIQYEQAIVTTLFSRRVNPTQGSSIYGSINSTDSRGVFTNGKGLTFFIEFKVDILRPALNFSFQILPVATLEDEDSFSNERKSDTGNKLSESTNSDNILGADQLLKSV